MKLFHVFLAYLASYVALVFADVDAIPYELLTYYYIHKLEMDAGYKFDERSVFYDLVPKDGEPYIRWGVVVQHFAPGSWRYQLTADDLTTFSPDEAAGKRVTQYMSNTVKKDPKRNKILTKGLNYYWDKFKEEENAKAGGGRLAVEMHDSMAKAIAKSGVNTNLANLQSVLSFTQSTKMERATKIGPAFLDYLKNKFPNFSAQFRADSYGLLDSEATYEAIEAASNVDTAEGMKQSIADATKVFLRLKQYFLPSGERVGGFQEHVGIIRKLGAMIDTVSTAVRNMGEGNLPVATVVCKPE